MLAPTAGDATEAAPLWFASTLAVDCGVEDAAGTHRSWATLRRSPVATA